MAHHYSIKATYNDFSLLEGGICAKTDADDLIFSPLSITTFGFLYNTLDIWLNADNIQQVTWTDCACNTTCD